jgi:hypothetical protein
MSEWQPIETAPKDRLTNVLLWFPYDGKYPEKCEGFCFIGIWGYPGEDDDICWIDPYDCDKLGDPTHWMPLPNPPSDGALR